MKAMHLKKSQTHTACGRNTIHVPMATDWAGFTSTALELRCVKCAESRQAQLNERKVKSESEAVYSVTPEGSPTPGDDAIIASALAILEQRLVRPLSVFSSPRDVGAYCALKANGLEHEVFSVLFLTAQHGLIDHVEMFRGTLMQTSVYPREVVKLAMQRNAAAVIVTHNHPSGNTTPSRADEALTQTLKAALALVDVRVLDHIITAGGTWISMAEKGLV